MSISAIGSSGSDVTSISDLMAQMKQKFFDKMDTDGDGVIDSKELTGLAKTTGKSASDLIKTYDKDQDGSLNATEFDSMIKEIRPNFRPDGMQGPPPPPDDRSTSSTSASTDTTESLLELLKNGKTDEAKTTWQSLLAESMQGAAYGASASTASSASLINLIA